MESQVLSWTSQDPRESSLFTTHWGVLYRFTTENTVGRMVTTLHRAIRQGREDRVAKLEWYVGSLLRFISFAQAYTLQLL